MKPTMFIGSSTELVAVARSVRANLEDVVESTVWDEDFFGLSKGTLDELTRGARRYDLATFVLGEDDVTLLRDKLHLVSRDNVVFELGIFSGALAKERCFFLVPQASPSFHVPSDLAGVTAAKYDPSKVALDSTTATADAAARICNSIQRLHSEWNLSGHWKHSWTSDNEKDALVHESPLELLVLSSHVRGRFVVDEVPFHLEGTVDRGNLVTVNYRSLVGPHGYTGTMHLIADPDGRSISGKWVGWSGRTMGVNSGRCQWTRGAKRVSKERESQDDG